MNILLGSCYFQSLNEKEKKGGVELNFNTAKTSALCDSSCIGHLDTELLL